MQSVMDDREVCDIFLRSVDDLEGLPNSDRLRMSILFQRVLRLLEQEQLHIRKGHIEPEIFESMNRARFEFLTLPGVQTWWNLSKERFADQYQIHVDDLIAKAQQKGYVSTFREERERSTKMASSRD